ncbi:AraC-like DNA-binding protein [Maribacter vaceletii]|uniref:AraC-like DNA-binding protein n=1 Tax=Maribacter vaceletii TaxID=1206816 RepID=A0A495EBS1_9FLAO|nr:helix-turn-helix domain-containing protein [Maribacter vaceletii]RKR14310.1 AraC-like DNA-binding protein [Maribacter vaceletii]
MNLLETLKLNLLHTGYAELDDKWDYENVISTFVRLFLVTKGSAEMEHSGSFFTLKPGKMYLIPSFTYNNYRCRDYHEQYYTGFFEETSPGVSIFNLNEFVYEVDASKLDEQYFKRLLELHPNMSVENSDPKLFMNGGLIKMGDSLENNLKLKLETKSILEILLSKFITNEIKNELKTSTGDLNKVLVYISKNLSKEISVDQLATFCNLNTDYFSRSFKSIYGVRPNRFIQLKRVERAQFLLLSSQKPLKQIAEEVGLYDGAYLSKTFKKLTGVTPAAFRKQKLSN